MPAAIPLIAAWAAYEVVGTTVAALIASAAASAAVAADQKRRGNRRARDEYNRSLREQTVTVKGGVNPRPIVYGRTAVGGQVIYAETHGSKKENLLMVVALAHGEVEEIETVYFNDVPLTLDSNGIVLTAPYNASGNVLMGLSATVPGSPYQVALNAGATSVVAIQDTTNGFGGGDSGSPPILQAGTDYTVSGTTVTFAAAWSGKTVQIDYIVGVTSSHAQIVRFNGGPTQDISSTMIAIGAPSWTTADKCRGFALLVVLMNYSDDVWPTGIPNIKAVIKGRKVYDPRTGLTTWSRNAALCARDYLTYLYGVNAASGKIDDTATTASANICDEDVQLTSSPATYQDRYTFDGAISTGDDRKSNLAAFAQSMAGSVNYSAGKWRIRAGAYTAPALTLDENKLSGEGSVQIVPFGTRRELINGAKGTFLNAAAGYVEDQFPEWSSTAFITEDGGAALTTSLVYRGVTDSTRAQRLAKIAVYRAREALSLAVTTNLSTYAWQVGDMVSVTLARYGFSAKPFRIIDRGFSATGGMRFSLREEPNGIYDWNLGEASVLSGAGNTTLPNPASVGVPTITGITSAQWLYKAGDGTFVARIRVAVTPPADEYVQRGGKLQLQYKRGDWSQDWVLLEADGAATQIWIDPAFDAQNYLIRVRAKNQAGYVSAWTAPQVHTCQGRPGQIVNLLRNSDWTQELGYPVGSSYSDSRALRHWTNISQNATDPRWGRNYNGGTVWNLGLGGCWFYDNGNTAPTSYFGIWQDVPVAAGVGYELGALVTAHRCVAQAQIQFKKADGSAANGGVNDVYDQINNDGLSPYTGYSIAEFDKLWCKGTAGSEAVTARVFLLCWATANDAPYPFSSWHQAMFNVAPSGVTRETATPWLPDGFTFPRGVGEAVSAQGAGHACATLAVVGSALVFQSGSQTFVTMALKAGETINIEWMYVGTVNIQATWSTIHASDIYVVGSGKTPLATNAPYATGNLVWGNQEQWPAQSSSDLFQSTRIRQYTAPTDQTVEIHAGIGINTGGGTIGSSTLTLRVYRLKV